MLSVDAAHIDFIVLAASKVFSVTSVSFAWILLNQYVESLFSSGFVVLLLCYMYAHMHVERDFV